MSKEYENKIILIFDKTMMSAYRIEKTDYIVTSKYESEIDIADALLNLAEKR